MTRKLSLKREALQELTTTDLTGVVGAAITKDGLCDTWHSCLTYESCACTPTIKPACW